MPNAVCYKTRGGVKFEELNPKQARVFQRQILATMLEVEKTYNLLAEEDSKNVLIVCDRGAMDPFACESLKHPHAHTHTHTHTHTHHKQSVQWRRGKKC